MADYPYYRRDVSDIPAETDGKKQKADHPSGYRPDRGLVDAVNVALVLNRPLLLTGEPGTGKTQLAHSVAWQLAGRKALKVASARVEKFETKSTSTSKELFYSFDTLRRFHAAQNQGSDKNVDYLTYNALGRAILNALPSTRVEKIAPQDFIYSGPTRSVVLIDEIDKAPRDFPNDLLNEIEQMYFRIPELGNLQVGGAEDLDESLQPIVIITSNSERNLPDPFLRRCIFYDIPFPGPEELEDILLSRLTGFVEGSRLLQDAMDFYQKLRKSAHRKISPAELIQWLSFMFQRQADPAKTLRDAQPVAEEGLGALVKDPTDKEKVGEELKAFLSKS